MQPPQSWSVEPRAGKRVPVVEDNRDIRELLVELLAGEGYRVSSAEHGEEALSKAKLEPPDVILLDLMMPVVSGWQFRERQLIEPSIAGVPVIVLSAYVNDLEVSPTFPSPFGSKTSSSPFISVPTSPSECPFLQVEP